VLVHCLYWLDILLRGWVLLIKEAELSAYFVEGASSYVPINMVAPRNVPPVC